ncbi:MAG: DinB family protein [Planctomycetota bacterium]
MEPTTLIDSYLDGPQLLRKAVAGMSQEQLVARPIPGKWSTLEVVCHLADFEIVCGDRIKRVNDRPHSTSCSIY